MISRISAVSIALLVVAACGGGGGSTPPPAASGVPTASLPSSTGATPAAVQPGEPIDGSGVSSAIDELESQDSWQFAVAITNVGTTTSITGTERRSPEFAVEASHTLSESETPFQYIRIGDSIWYDVGTGEFTEVQADKAQNLIDQYEPYYINGLRDSVDSQNFEFDFVDNQTISGIPSAHYLLSESDRENIVQTLDMDPADFAGDVYIATDGGYVTRLTWGPQSVENASLTIGWDYLVTAVNCECPIEPPTGSAGSPDPY